MSWASVMSDIPGWGLKAITCRCMLRTIGKGIRGKIFVPSPGRGSQPHHQQKNLFPQTDRARFSTNSIRSFRPVLPDLPCLLCLSFLAYGGPRRPTFPPQPPTPLLRPQPLLVPPPCIHPLILSSTGLLPTPCGCARPATISATLTPLAT